MASLVLFLCFAFVMFEAGYYWREWAGTPADGNETFGYRRDDRHRDSMIGKI